MVIYWLYKYKVIDRDIGVLSLISLEEAKEIEFPMPSLCLIEPFIDKSFNTNHSIINSTDYIKYLKGNASHNSVETIDYERVTLNLNDYFLFATEVWRNDSDTTINSSQPIQHVNTFNGFNSEDKFIKCISPDVDLSNHRHIKTISFNYNKTKLLTDWKGSLTIEAKFGFKLHGKGQFLLGDEPKFLYYFKITNDDSTWDSFDFTIKELEIIEARNSRNTNCDIDFSSYDQMMVKQYVAQKGCKAPYINKHISAPFCNTLKGIKNAKLTYGRTKTIDTVKPCKRISKLMDNLDLSIIKNIWRIQITFPDEVKTIIMSKEVDIHTLIGNVGGYLGLLMGYAVVRIPNGFFWIYDFLTTKPKGLSIYESPTQHGNKNF